MLCCLFGSPQICHLSGKKLKTCAFDIFKICIHIHIQYPPPQQTNHCPFYIIDPFPIVQKNVTLIQISCTSSCTTKIFHCCVASCYAGGAPIHPILPSLSCPSNLTLPPSFSSSLPKKNSPPPFSTFIFLV